MFTTRYGFGLRALARLAATGLVCLFAGTAAQAQVSDPDRIYYGLTGDEMEALLAESGAEVRRESAPNGDPVFLVRLSENSGFYVRLTYCGQSARAGACQFVDTYALYERDPAAHSLETINRANFVNTIKVAALDASIMAAARNAYTEFGVTKRNVFGEIGVFISIAGELYALLNAARDPSFGTGTTGTATDLSPDLAASFAVLSPGGEELVMFEPTEFDGFSVD